MTTHDTTETTTDDPTTDDPTTTDPVARQLRRRAADALDVPPDRLQHYASYHPDLTVAAVLRAFAGGGGAPDPVARTRVERWLAAREARADRARDEFAAENGGDPA